VARTRLSEYAGEVLRVPGARLESLLDPGLNTPIKPALEFGAERVVVIALTASTPSRWGVRAARVGEVAAAHLDVLREIGAIRVARERPCREAALGKL
jgi:hypothetical protein